MGYRKKNKLEIGTVMPDEVKEWLEKVRGMQQAMNSLQSAVCNQQ